MSKPFTREGIITAIKPYLTGYVVRLRVNTHLYFSEKLLSTLWIDLGTKKGTLRNIFQNNIYDLLGLTIKVRGKYHTHYGSEYKSLLYVDEVISLQETKKSFKTKPHTKERLLEIVKKLNSRTKLTESSIKKILQSPFLPVNCSLLKDFHMCYTIYKLLEIDSFIRTSDHVLSLEVFGNYFVHLFQKSLANSKEGLIYTDNGYGISFDYAFYKAVKDLPFIFSEAILDEKVKEILEKAKNGSEVDVKHVLQKLFPYLIPWFLVKKNPQHGYVLYPHYYRRTRELALQRTKLVLTLNNSKNWEDTLNREKLAKEVADFLTKHRPPIFVLTGTAGTGKSTFVVELVKHLNKNGLSVKVTGITGKSVKRLNELFINRGYQPIAKTLARELGQKHNGDYNTKLINSEVLIVDEASMMNVLTLARINKILHNEQTLILVGDPKQLEPIRDENIFLTIVDLLKNTPFLLELKYNFRFTSDRKIYVLAVRQIEKIPSLIVAILRKNKILTDFKKWKVATYTHRQDYVGTEYLNTYIRQNITSTEPFFPGEPALVVDNEIDQQTKHLKLANKEEVKVLSLNGDEAKVMTLTGTITQIKLDKLSYSYAVEYRTVQGEEYEVFIFIALKNKINRNILHTMLTRGKKKVYMITTVSSLDYIREQFADELRNAEFYKESFDKKWLKV